MNESIDLTAEQQASIGAAMLKAAFSALGPPPEPDGNDEDQLVGRIVRAWAAAERVRREALKQARKKPGEYVYLETESYEAVASAYSLWGTENPLTADCSPASVAGGRLLVFAQAMAAISALANGVSLIESDIDGAFLHDGALKLLPFIDT